VDAKRFFDFVSFGKKEERKKRTGRQGYGSPKAQLKFEAAPVGQKTIPQRVSHTGIIQIIRQELIGNWLALAKSGSGWNRFCHTAPPQGYFLSRDFLSFGLRS
jgi:hypothetical protein